MWTSRLALPCHSRSSSVSSNRRDFPVGSGLFIMPSDQLFVAAQPDDGKRGFASKRRSSRNNPGLGIMWDVVRVLTRLVKQLAKALKLPRVKGFCDRSRSAHRRMYEIQR